MQAIRSAVALGLRPSAHILMLRNPRSKWTPEDHVAAIAYQMVNDETCPECGNPVWVCRSTNRDIEFTVEFGTCYVDKAKSSSKKKLKDGDFLYVRPRMRDGSALPDRDEYYQNLAEERAIHEKGRRST